MKEGVADFVLRCQTHEGGIGGEPGAEAHGGYTFCGLAAAMLCGRADRLDLPELLHWLAHRQGAVEVRGRLLIRRPIIHSLARSLAHSLAHDVKLSSGGSLVVCDMKRHRGV